MTDLPLISSHARSDYGRCPKKWYWRWLLGLIPLKETFGALTLGTWVHEAFNEWYRSGLLRKGKLAEHLATVAYTDIETAKTNGAPDNLIEKAEEQAALGQAMMRAYEQHYGKDSSVYALAKEIPLEFDLGIATFKLKPDMVFHDRERRIWLMEHKTAATIRTGHLVIDNQARPYAAMAERALLNAGVLSKGETLHGIMYNFLRKALPDERPVNAEGKRLNMDGSVSARQPSPYFLRHPVRVTKQEKAITLKRVVRDAYEMTALRARIKDGTLTPEDIRKTPHYSCERTCDYFTMCVTEESGGDITDLKRSQYRKANPYEYYQESTDEPQSFEMG